MTSGISVIIPAYNAEAFLDPAIESALSQTLPAAEIIVIDDGSTDGTAEVARSFGEQISLLQQANAGTGPARNLGLQHSRGEFIALLDADDLMTRDRLEVQSRYLIEHPELDIVFGQQCQFEDGQPPQLAEGTGPWVVENAPIPGTMFCGKAVFDRVGPFDGEHRVGECVEWLKRATDQGLRIDTIKHLVLHRRRHENNQSRVNREQFVHVLKGMLDRRRAQ